MIKVRVARVSQCPRALSLHLKKVPQGEVTNPDIKKTYDDGERIEEEVFNYLISEGYDVEKKRYKKVIEIEGVKILLSGTPDFTIHKKRDYPGEIKSMNPWKYSKVPNSDQPFVDWQDKLKEKYGAQLSLYAWLTDSKLVYWIIKEKKKTDDGKVRIIKVPIEQLPDPLELLETKISKAIRVITHEEDILPENLKVDCKWCRYNDAQEWWKSTCATTWFNPSKEKISKLDKQLVKLVKETKEDINELMLLTDEKSRRMYRFDSLLIKKYGKVVTK